MFHIRRALISLLLASVLAGCATGGNFAKEPTSEERAEAAAVRRSRVHYDMGAAHLNEDKPGAAIRELLQAARIVPEDPAVQRLLAQAYWRRGRMVEAETHLTRALELDPTLHGARNNLAAFYIHTERYEQAIDQLQILVDDATFDEPWTAHTNLGWAAFRLGRVDEAHRQLQLALDYRPTYWPAKLNMGIVEADSGNADRAVELFESVLERAPGPRAESEVHYRLAEIHEALGQRQQAIVHLSEARDRRPDGPWGKRSEESLKRLQ